MKKTFHCKLSRIASLYRSRIEQNKEISLESLEEYFNELRTYIKVKQELSKELELKLDISKGNLKTKNLANLIVMGLN